MEVTILIPCLNEEKTVTACVKQAVTFLRVKALEGEVLVVDNNSTDETARLAEEAGARVVSCPRKGYGNAIHYGILKAAGSYILLGDGDGSYHFDEGMPLLEELKKGADLVIGDRFCLPMEEGAMPFSHRYVGVPLLSFLGRVVYGTDVRDFHCGLRALRKEAYLTLDCRCGGMEFATEMIGRAARKGLTIRQAPVVLYRDGRGHPSHLRTIRDGVRHLAVLMGVPLKDERKEGEA